MYSQFKTLENLIDYHLTSEQTMFLCDLTGLSVDDRDFDSLQAWFDGIDPFYNSACTMRRSGGSFAGAIGDAYQCADSRNRVILVNAFQDLFKRFMPTSVTDEA